MTTKEQNTPGTVDIVKYADLLRRLAHDDGFRARFSGDPQSVLRELGIPFDAQRVPETVELPDKAVLQAEYQVRLTELAHLRGFPLCI